MKYYGWAGKHEGKIHFMIDPIIKVHNKSEFHKGWLVVDTDTKNGLHNFEDKDLRGSEVEVEVDQLNVFNTKHEAMREAIRGVFRA